MTYMLRYGPADLLSMTTRCAIHHCLVILSRAVQPPASKDATPSMRAVL